MASRKSTKKTVKRSVKNSSKKNSNNKKAKSTKKNSVKKAVNKRSPAKIKKTVSKKSTKKAVKKTVKKVISKKAPTKKQTLTKKTPKKNTPRSTSIPPFRDTAALEQETINKLISEIRSLEKNNYQLAMQLDKAETKKEIILELKSYLSELKNNNNQSNAYTINQRTIDQTSKELKQTQERVNSKDKLISRLKSLVAGKQGELVEEQEDELPSIENIRHTYPGSVDSKWEESRPIEVEVEESNTNKKEEVEKMQTETKPSQNTNQESENQEKKPEVSAKDVVDKKLAEIEENSEKKKEEYQANKTKGLITPEEAIEYSKKLKDMEFEINKVFIGQESAVKGVLLSVLCSAHSLLEGVPGLAKTLLIETLGLVVDGTTFKRIQFLPDLLPSDIIGGQVFNPKTAEYTIYKGPIFANFVLADEINRAPPKTHAAIMEAMQEKKINIESETFILDKPFFVLATQNPLENKGTYELPEAVLDRFLFKVVLDYPERKYELSIITENSTTKDLKKNVRPVLTKEEVLHIQKKVKQVYISDKIREYIMDLVEATRGVNKNIEGMKFVKYGAGVRASIGLCLGAQANAVFEGRNYVLPDDVDAVAMPILRHRVVVNYRGKAHNITPEKIVEEIISKVKAL